MRFGDEEMLTLQQAAERLHISPVTLRKQAKNGVLRCTMVGHTYLVTGSEVARYEKENKGRVGPKPKKGPT